jgi:hypothetical protein
VKFLVTDGLRLLLCFCVMDEIGYHMPSVLIQNPLSQVKTLKFYFTNAKKLLPGSAVICHSICRAVLLGEIACRQLGSKRYILKSAIEAYFSTPGDTTSPQMLHVTTINQTSARVTSVTSLCTPLHCVAGAFLL